MMVAPPPTPSADSPLVRGQVEIPLQARGSVLRAKARGRAGGNQRPERVLERREQAFARVSRNRHPPATRVTFASGVIGADSLVTLGARDYDPRRALFTSPDTIIPALYNPQALNLFAYTYNNPLKYTDPSGHFAETHEERWALIRRSTNDYGLVDSWYADRDRSGTWGHLLNTADFGDVMTTCEGNKPWDSNAPVEDHRGRARRHFVEDSQRLIRVGEKSGLRAFQASTLNIWGRYSGISLLRPDSSMVTKEQRHQAAATFYSWIQSAPLTSVWHQI